ncbi:CheR family methyltransferase [Paenibacillus turpanensis]|uniref:CheR family methyltransferase n=1 Tax=Paenibacillus turpanensis TaxID=2689078 RepID=UPI00140E66B5|nr:protein-glutamate O-methyltransferase CheR [Paenibacillus turpanensis]
MTNQDQRSSYEALIKIEIDLLLEGVYRHYGYDFRNYSFGSIKRRTLHRVQAERLPTVSALQELVLHNPDAMHRLINDFSVTVTEMFRDDDFFRAFREKVVPNLRNLPQIRIWHAGCSTGEEVYSMAILLHEEGLYDKTRLYATDINAEALNKAESGLFPLQKMQLYTKNYLQSGGKRAFSEYYSVRNEVVRFQPYLSDNMVFFQHNLATDHSFNEFHVVICRNVLIYFNDVLQQRVLKLFDESLHRSGFLGLGSKEGMTYKLKRNRFTEYDAKCNIFRKTDERFELWNVQ